MKQKGFTLIEVMIVVVVIGILASIAYPAYLDYVMDARRAEGKAAIANVAQRMERCFTESNTYAPAGGCVANFATENGYYNISVNADATSYTITAAQTFGDGECGNLTLTHTGVKGANNVAACW